MALHTKLAGGGYAEVVGEWLIGKVLIYDKIIVLCTCERRVAAGRLNGLRLYWSLGGGSSHGCSTCSQALVNAS